MNTLIIYGSQYGSTKRYAQHLSETTGIEAVGVKGQVPVTDLF